MQQASTPVGQLVVHEHEELLEQLQVLVLLEHVQGVQLHVQDVEQAKEGICGDPESQQSSLIIYTVSLVTTSILRILV